MKNIKILIAVSALLITGQLFAATWDSSVNTSTWWQNNSSFQAIIPPTPKLISKTSNSVKLEWDKTNWVSKYIVKYSETSVVQSKELNVSYTDESDAVTQTGIEIKNLKPNTDYYFALSIMDDKNYESDMFSDEIKVTTDKVTTTASATTQTVTWWLSISNINVIDDKNLSIDFNNQLSDELIQIKITKNSNSSDIIIESINKDSTNGNKVNVKTSTVLEKSSSYTLTVITAKDINWNNIQEWINWIKEFATDENIKQSSESLSTLPQNTTETGVTLNSADIKIDTSTGSSTTATAETLAKTPTGTKENLLIGLALILSFSIIYRYRKWFLK